MTNNSVKKKGIKKKVVQKAPITRQPFVINQEVNHKQAN